MPKTHIMAFTYKPKIEAVFSGECTRTMRFTRTVGEGDLLLIHDWEGVPYRSKWGRRMYKRVLNVSHIVADMKGLTIYDDASDACFSTPWEDRFCGAMAKDDGIEPPPGDDRPLGLVWLDVLLGLNKQNHKNLDFDIGAEGSIIIWGDC